MKFSTWTTIILFYPTVVIYLDPDDNNGYQNEEKKNAINKSEDKSRLNFSADVVWGFYSGLY